MELGAFSISLTVADLHRSRAFYETLGFEVVGGEAEHDWLMMRNGPALIGLFQGMFDANLLTFNPGLRLTSEGHEQTADRTDVREIQRRLDAAGLELTERTDPDGTGAGHIALTDPDGNAILIDQFD